VTEADLEEDRREMAAAAAAKAKAKATETEPKAAGPPETREMAARRRMREG